MPIAVIYALRPENESVDRIFILGPRTESISPQESDPVFDL